MGTKNFSDLTSFKIGGKIRKYIEISDEDEITGIIGKIKKDNLPIFIIGGGTDILVSDKDFEGVVIKYTGDKIKVRGEMLTAEAGAVWDDVVKLSVENNLQGIECLSGIPGTAGAAPIQNIGAYGQELKDTLTKIKVYDIQNEKFVTYTNKDCKFDYRESIFKSKSHWQKYIICSVTLKLVKNGKALINYDSLKNNLKGEPTLQNVRDSVIFTRRQRIEDYDNFGNAGSFFKNPIVDQAKKLSLEKLFSDIKIYPFKNKYKIAAGWLVEKTGWKGKEFGNAGVSPKHALILINRTGRATAEDVFKLSEEIIKDVNNKFGIILEREVQLINF